jgi:hypothetical protein
VPRRIKAANDWQIGEVAGLRLQSGKWTLTRTVGHHSDKGGRFAVCEILDWVGDEIPPAAAVSELPHKRPPPPRTAVAQFMLGMPRKKHDQARLLRLGIVSTPAQKPGNVLVLAWPRIDRTLDEWYGLK